MHDHPKPLPTTVSRRDFLQLTTGGIAFGAITPGLRTQQDAHASTFQLKFDAGAIVSLKRAADSFDTEYVQQGRRIGDVLLKYRRSASAWESFDTATFSGRTVSLSENGAQYRTVYAPPNGAFELRNEFVVSDNTVQWNIEVENLGTSALEIGDLALPLPMNGNFQQQPTTAVLKHSLIAGDGSFLFWMRRNSVGPYLTMTPGEATGLEYWESQGGYRAFIHSAASGGAAKEGGTKWRQPNTSLTLSARGRTGSKKRYSFKLHWAADYNDVRAIVAREGLVDVQVIPGMTLPRDTSARIALRSAAAIQGITAEFPRDTTVKRIGRTGDAEIFEVRFSKLGENRLTVKFGADRHMHLEFFSTEPVETMIAKRAAFVASHQFRDPSKWYNGLLAEWAMDTRKLLGPDDYDRIKGWRIYEVTCDDPGLSKPAYLALKNAERPVQSEIAAIDYYIEHFVWGGLQRSSSEEFTYGIYGIPDWKQNRDSKDPGRNGRKHIWRIYDYPHIALMYFSMYRVAKHSPQIKTSLTASEYLKRAYGTAVAMFTIPFEIERWSAYQTGLYNELVIPEILVALDREGMREQAERLRAHWERKVRSFVAERPDLFRSEYAFDSTGFESTHALVKYALENADEFNRERPTNGRAPKMPVANMHQFLDQQMQANIFCRGWLETAYYLYGSDYRGSGGNSYTLTYMSAMGGWSVLDYALYYAADYAPYLRLGYASALSSWALLNSGTPESNYGYWYPGVENDGGAGGGFEPAPFGNTWLEQPHRRGSWYYSCEIDLGFCGALRCARTVIADDGMFGRVAYGGNWSAANSSISVVPNDGVNRRFHALLGGKRLHAIVASDRFAPGRPVVVSEGLTSLKFDIATENVAPHATQLSLRSHGAATFAVRAGTFSANGTAKANQDYVVEIPVNQPLTSVTIEITHV